MKRFFGGTRGLTPPSAVASCFPALPRFTGFNIKVKYEQSRQFFIWPRSVIVLAPVNLDAAERNHISLPKYSSKPTRRNPLATFTSSAGTFKGSLTANELAAFRVCRVACY